MTRALDAAEAQLHEQHGTTLNLAAAVVAAYLDNLSVPYIAGVLWPMPEDDIAAVLAAIRHAVPQVTS